MEKDTRYKAIKVLIESAKIQSIKDVFKYVSMVVTAEQLRFTNHKMMTLINNPENWQEDEMIKLANLFEVDISHLQKIIGTKE